MTWGHAPNYSGPLGLLHREGKMAAWAMNTFIIRGKIRKKSTHTTQKSRLDCDDDDETTPTIPAEGGMGAYPPPHTRAPQRGSPPLVSPSFV